VHESGEDGSWQWQNERPEKGAREAKGEPTTHHIEYHVVPNGDRWDVERDDCATGSFAYNVHTAIGLAIAAAQRDQNSGIDVKVCVQEKGGHCRQVWP
jgi:hypothetical protein